MQPNGFNSVCIIVLFIHSLYLYSCRLCFCKWCSHIN